VCVCVCVSLVDSVTALGRGLKEQSAVCWMSESLRAMPINVDFINDISQTAAESHIHLQKEKSD